MTTHCLRSLIPALSATVAAASLFVATYTTLPDTTRPLAPAPSLPAKPAHDSKSSGHMTATTVSPASTTLSSVSYTVQNLITGTLDSLTMEA